MGRSSFLVFLIFLANLTGCEPDLSDDPIPYQPFPDIIINLNLPEYFSLKVDGGYTIMDGGVRGIIIYRVNSNQYLAFERNCSFHPNDACATVDVEITGLNMIDPCCGSTFSFSNGAVISGVAWRPLRQYYTELDFNDLTITDEVIE